MLNRAHAIFLSFLACTVLSMKQDVPPQNPIIGVYTQTYNSTNSYIPSTYVKFVEMSGAQVVPLFAFSSTSEILALLPKLNGVLFTGGTMDYNISQIWTKNADAILKYAMEQNDKGNPFPIWGTCMGLQILSYLTSQYNDTLLTRVYGDISVHHPLEFTTNNTYLFGDLSLRQNQKLTKGNGIMWYFHDWAVSIDSFRSNSYMDKFWNLIATSTSPKNQRFVAVLEAKKYPFYAVQFHPQKNIYDWSVDIDRSLEAIEISQIMSNKFVEVARKSKNRFLATSQFTDISIYNYQTEHNKMGFTIYVFKEIPKTDIAPPKNLPT